MCARLSRSLILQIRDLETETNGYASQLLQRSVQLNEASMRILDMSEFLKGLGHNPDNVEHELAELLTDKDLHILGDITFLPIVPTNQPITAASKDVPPPNRFGSPVLHRLKFSLSTMSTGNFFSKGGGSAL